MRLTRRSLVLGAAAGATVTASPGRFALHAAESGAAQKAAPALDCTFPPLGNIAYHVLREGATFGKHIATFKRDGEDFIARNDIEIVARVFGIAVYRYTHWSEEIWRDGLLMDMRSETNKDGKKKSVRGERKDGVLNVRGDGREHALSGFVLTTSLWHGRTPEAEVLLDMEDAELRKIGTRFVGTEKVKVEGQPKPARHYLLSRDMERDVWYGEDCRLLRVGFNTKKDGSRIELQPYDIQT